MVQIRPIDEVRQALAEKLSEHGLLVLKAIKTGFSQTQQDAVQIPLDRPGGGNFLVASGIVENEVREIDWNGLVVNRWTGLWNPHSAERLPDGTTLIADSGNNRIIQVDNAGNVLKTLSFTNPQHVKLLHNGNWLITVTGEHRVVEYNPSTGAIERQFGVTNTPGSDHSHLWSPSQSHEGPHPYEWIAIGDWYNDRVLILNRAMDTLLYKLGMENCFGDGLYQFHRPAVANIHPRFITRVLVSDARNNRVVEYDLVTRSGMRFGENGCGVLDTARVRSVTYTPDFAEYAHYLESDPRFILVSGAGYIFIMRPSKLVDFVERPIKKVPTVGGEVGRGGATWWGRTISDTVNGETTDPIYAVNRVVEFEFLSDQGGTLYVLSDKNGNGTYRTELSQSITANTPWVSGLYPGRDFGWMRLRFIPSAPATIYCRVGLIPR